MQNAGQFCVQTSKDSPNKTFDYISSPPPYLVLQRNEIQTSDDICSPKTNHSSFVRGSRPLQVNVRNGKSQSHLNRPFNLVPPSIVQPTNANIRRADHRRPDDHRSEAPTGVPPRHFPLRASVYRAPSNVASPNAPNSVLTHSSAVRDGDQHPPAPPAPNIVPARQGSSQFQRASSSKLRPASAADYQSNFWRS